MSTYLESNDDAPGIHVIYTDNLPLLQQFAVGFCEAYADNLDQGETILYLNCSTSEGRLARAFDPARRRKGSRWLKTQTFRSGEIAKSIPMLESALKFHNVRLLVINSLEFAVLSSHHKAQFIPWLRTVRDHCDCDVMLLMTRKLAPYGSERTLGIWADLVSELEQVTKEIDPSEDAEEEDGGPDDVSPDSEGEDWPVTSDEHTVMLYDEETGDIRRETLDLESYTEVDEDEDAEDLQTTSLKTNDLRDEILNPPSSALKVEHVFSFMNRTRAEQAQSQTDAQSAVTGKAIGT